MAFLDLTAFSRLLVFVAPLTVALVPVLRHDEQQEADFIKADVIFMNNLHRTNRHARDSSSDLRVVIRIHNDSLHLDLTRTFHLEDPIIVMSTEEGKLRRSQEPELRDYLLYQDVQNGASILVHHITDPDNSRTLRYLLVESSWK
ncbi:uncharacterized protein LOC135463301 [Liolophura sinensis]|uniref:uncharacterized protein LOC135463301 n=1 Tax=Liolophura sinensis TaxID=3198878 RepID=UPI00315993FE